MGKSSSAKWAATDGEEAVVAEGCREVPGDVGDVRLAHMSAQTGKSKGGYRAAASPWSVKGSSLLFFRSREST
jgi:hypothetical protein